MRRLRVISASFLLLLAAASFPPAVSAQARQRIERADQLPRRVYPVPSRAMALLDEDSAFQALAGRLEADIRADLASYEIADRATLKGFYGTLGELALVRGEWATAVAYGDSIGAIEDKPGPRLLAGIVERALAAAAKASPDRYQASFREVFEREVAGLPWSEVQAELRTMKAMLDMRAPNMVVGRFQADLAPGARSGQTSRALAQQVVAMRAYLQRVVPVRGVLLDVLGQAIAAHAVAKPDIWPARDVSLAGRAGLTPVTVAIWDTGVATALFPERLWTNPREVPENGRDDDGNGYVDDVHGIAHDLHSVRTTGELLPLTLTPAQVAEYRGYLKGFMDLQAGVDSREAAAVRQKAASTPPAEVRGFMEAVNQYGDFAHGTHVAGIAARANPAVRLLVARLTFDYRMVPELPTLELAQAGALEMRETIEYFRQAGVRVVNMSWHFSPGDLERALEANNAGGTPEERRALARKQFRIVADALRNAMADAAGILFVAAAGNEDADNAFAEYVPASLELPNLITAAAVDQAGDETAFTSYGRVDVYANGYEVPSLVPGGETMPLSGTSMAAPQVANLAAKLLALRPQLTVAELRRAIVGSADVKTIGPGKQIRLLNPAAALAAINAQ